jgi:hypothetical protein
MKTKIDKLGNELGVNVAAIRLAVGKLTGARLPWDPESKVYLVNQGDRMVRCYENWLLDDEQKQMLSVQPGDKFILYASSYLCDIGLTGGQGFPPLAKDSKDDRTRAFFDQSLSTRSCRLIRDGWQDLGLPERAFVSFITRVCLQLFMGNRLYSDKRVFLRELIQNAVDACNYRKLTDNHYSPAIAIEFNDDVSTIKVRDNGIGMTRQWIEKYFLAIGISFYQSNEIRDVNRDPRIDFGFISQFGIWFLSSFQVADKIIIKTRTFRFTRITNRAL